MGSSDSLSEGDGSLAEAITDVLSALPDTGKSDLVDAQISVGIPNVLEAWVSSDHQVTYGTGIGKKASVPWVSVQPKASGSSKLPGFFVVYLFAADGSAVYLSLNQRTDEIKGGLKPLKKRAADLRTAALIDSAGQEMDLRKAEGGPARYEAANAYAIKYGTDSIPDDDVLREDLQKFLNYLGEAVDSGLQFNEQLEPTHLILKWSTKVNPETIQAHREVAEAEGSVWWGLIQSKDSPIGDSSRSTIERQLEEGIPTYVYLYGGGKTFQAKLEKLATDPSEVDDARMCDYYDKEDCQMLLLLSEFAELPGNWLNENVVLARDPDPARLQGGLNNQTTPLYVYKLFRPNESANLTKPGAASSVESEFDLQWLVEQTLWEEDEVKELLASLETSGQLILAGPPGTGKTWISEALSRFLTQDQAHRVRTVQLHPSYGYEEFVEGLRPVVTDGAISFDRVDGVILEMAKKAKDDNQVHVLIVDELNRANIPRVFGELFYLLEYRDKEIDLQFSRDFRLPSNLKLIATMNTADRSTRSIDIALRRRFDIFECPADAGVLERFYDSGSRVSMVKDLVSGFKALNADLTAQLDRHHTIGQSFFMANEFTNFDLRRAWLRQIMPLIEDYFFDQEELIKQFDQKKYWPSS